jgi:hypothetical protein
MAYQKPFLMLDKKLYDQPEKMRLSYELNVFYGIYPSYGHMDQFNNFNYEPVRKLNDTFVPILRKISRAGWYPVTNAWSDNSDVWIERWGAGSDGIIYLTIYNNSENTVSTEITIDVQSMGIQGDTVQFSNLRSGYSWHSSFDGGNANLCFAMPPKSVQVISLRFMKNNKKFRQIDNL